MKKILVPTDFSPNANKALDFAVQIAKQAKAEIILIHAFDLIDTVFKDHQNVYKEHNQNIIEKTNANLSLLKKNIEGTGNLSVSIKLYKGKVTDTILQASEEHHADLIIMGTLGVSRLKEKIFGSKTAGIIGKINVPVMAVPLLSEWGIPEKILLVVNDFEEQPDIINPVFELAAMFNAIVHIAIFTDIDSAEAVDYLEHKRSITSCEERLKAHYKNTNIRSVHLSGHKFQETIEEYILEQGIDIVTMVTQKRTFVESIFNPSITKKMSYHTRVPLLVIPA
ncbi:MAG: universal stress protein [Chitinophagaceae bacterium]|jgi:nucleotide-binding universal stress UspA family protein|nr:universal stress protein [Chitinophagaceae bacterium]